MVPVPAGDTVFGEHPAGIPVGRYGGRSAPGVFPADVEHDVAFVRGDPLIAKLNVFKDYIVGPQPG